MVPKVGPNRRIIDWAVVWPVFRQWRSREWRIVTGLLMWAYMAGHMINHSLGVLSLSDAEAGMRSAVRAIHFMPLTVLLYGAFSLHLFLALRGLFRRPSLRMPWTDALRIALGLSFPMLLIGHVFATRVSYEWFQLPPEYGRVVAGLIASGAEGKQLALLAPGWAHGCLGLDMSLKRKPAWHVWRRLFWSVAIGLPLLAAAGFLSMEKEVSALLSDPLWRDKVAVRLASEHAALVQTRREWVVNAYAGVIGLTLLARWAARVRTGVRPD